jgi:NDP-sugar pyrophosphorylase family protein
MVDAPPVTQALVLAGGKGTRLRPLTEDKPKPMVEVAGRPFLELLLDHLAAEGIEEAVLSIGYLGETIRDHLGDGDHLDLAVRYAEEEEPLGTGGGVENAEALLDERFYLLYGDTYAPVDLHGLAWAQEELGTTGVLTAYTNEDPRLVADNVVVEPGPDEAPRGLVRAHDKDEKQAAMNGLESGVSLWSRDVCERIPAGEKVSLEREVYPDLVATEDLGAFWSDERFWDIGTPDRLEVARRDLA